MAHLWHRLLATVRLMRGVWAAGYTADLCALLAVYGQLGPLQRAVVTHVASTTADPAFWQARDAVQRTAITLGLNKRHTWDELMNTVQSQPQWAENQWRHVHALKLLHKRVVHSSRQLPNPMLNLLTEVAYVSYVIQPKD